MKTHFRVLVLSVLLISFAFLLSGCKSSDYKTATSAMASGDYQTASDLFRSLDDYKDSRVLALVSTYHNATNLLKEGRYAEAEKNFKLVGNYQDAAQKAFEAHSLDIMQRIAGVWTTELAAGDLLRDTLGQNADALSYAENIDFASMIVKLTLTPDQNGTLSIGLEPSSFESVWNAFMDGMADGIRSSYQKQLAEALTGSKQFSSVEAYLAEFGFSSLDDYFEVMHGISLYDFLASAISKEAFVKALSLESTYTVDGKTLWLNDQTSIDFNEDQNTLTLHIPNALDGLVFTR